MAESPSTSELNQLTSGEIYLVVLFCYINTINYMDRVGIASVLVKIQDHFQIGDHYGGLLQTILLTAYTFSAPFFGYCGDRFSRKWLIMCCMLVWAISTVGGAFAEHFWILLLSRMLVGVGQSGFTTITPTVISDIVLHGARILILSCYCLGVPIGGGLGYVVSVSVTKLTGSWRYGLCVGPLLCLIGVVLLSFTRFPKRGEKEVTNLDSGASKVTTFKEDLSYLMSVPSFITVTAAFTCVCFCIGAIAWWIPKCLYFGFMLIPNGSENNLQSPSFYFGAVTVLTGVLGVLLGLMLSRLLRPRFPNCDPIICGLGLLFASPWVVAALTVIANSKILTFTCIFISMLQINLNWAIKTDILLSVVMPLRRTSAQGIHMLFNHALGDCISPYIIGYMSEYLKNNFQFTNESFFLPYKNEKPVDSHAVAQNFHSLQFSLFCTVVIIFILGGIFFLITARFIVKDIERANS